MPPIRSFIEVDDRVPPYKPTWKPAGTIVMVPPYIPWKDRTTLLERRRFLWLIGIPSPSLIHNGKKRRKV